MVYCEDCDLFEKLCDKYLEWVILVSWLDDVNGLYLLIIKVEVIDCFGLIWDISLVFVNEKVNVLNMNVNMVEDK